MKVKRYFLSAPSVVLRISVKLKTILLMKKKRVLGKKGVIKIVVKEHKTEEEEESKDFTESISKGGYAAEESIEEPLEKEKRAIKIDAKESKKNYLKLQIKT